MTNTPIPCPFCGDPMKPWGDGTHVSHIGTDENCPVWHLGIFVEKWNRRTPIKIKSLKWREIDPERCYVGTGLGFTCEVRLLRKGGWEGVWPLSNGEFRDKATAMTVIEAAYVAMVMSYLETD